MMNMIMQSRDIIREHGQDKSKDKCRYIIYDKSKDMTSLKI